MTQTRPEVRPPTQPAKRIREGMVRPFMILVAAVALGCLTPGSATAQARNGAQQPAQASGKTQTVLGDVVPFGDGTARSWVELDAAGHPTAVGVTLTEAALNGLPADVTPGLIWMVEYLLAVPPGYSMLPFDHIGVNWNPKGHIPNGIYNVPHFDFHFYTIGREQRSQITARGADLEKCRKAPAAGLLPDGFMFAPDSEEPGMGGHWVDPVSHEFHGEAFTSTFIYGTYDGNVIFFEPMITLAYLTSKPDVTVPVRAPQRYARSGYYPTSYSVRYDAGRKEYTVALGTMKLYQATASR